MILDFGKLYKIDFIDHNKGKQDNVCLKNIHTCTTIWDVGVYNFYQFTFQKIWPLMWHCSSNPSLK